MYFKIIFQVLVCVFGKVCLLLYFITAEKAGWKKTKNQRLKHNNCLLNLLHIQGLIKTKKKSTKANQTDCTNLNGFRASLQYLLLY